MGSRRAAALAKSRGRVARQTGCADEVGRPQTKAISEGSYVSVQEDEHLDEDCWQRVRKQAWVGVR